MSFLTNLATRSASFINNFSMKVVPNISDDAGGSGSKGTPPAQSSAVASKVNEILNSWIGPLFTVIGAIGAVYIIILAVQYAKAENDNKRAEVKTRIVNCAIGVVSLLVIGSLCLWVDWQAVANIFGYAVKK